MRVPASLAAAASSFVLAVSGAVLVPAAAAVPAPVGADRGSSLSPDTPTASAGTLVLGWAFTVAPGLVVSESNVAVEEGRPGATYDVSLSTQPSADVVVTVVGDADCGAAPSPLTFTSVTWNIPQTVTVSAPDDSTAEPTEDCTVTHTVASADPAYDGLTAPSVTGTVTDKLVTSIGVTTPVEGASFTQGSPVVADFACLDNRSGAGIASCVGTVADGAAVDTSTVGSHSFTVTLTDVHGGVTTETNTYAVTAAPVPPVPPAADGRPDARISSPGSLVGDDVYAGKKQKKAAKAAVGKKVTFTVSLQNDAAVADQLKVRGGKSANGFKVKYLAPDGTNITKAVVAGTYTTASLAPGATFDVRVVVKVGKKAAKKLKTSVTATSARTPAATDTVNLVTKRK